MKTLEAQMATSGVTAKSADSGDISVAVYISLHPPSGFAGVTLVSEIVDARQDLRPDYLLDSL
jgi:hypothetical protein